MIDSAIIQREKPRSFSSLPLYLGIEYCVLGCYVRVVRR